MSEKKENIFVGIDIGGTFTDVVVFNSKTKEVELLKIPSTPDNPENAVIKALESIQIDLNKISMITHASTVATNALLTKNNIAKAALITNKGFKDILEIGRQRRSQIYDLEFSRPEPLIKRKFRYTISGRITFDGKEIEPINRKEIEILKKKLAQNKIEAVAISLLNSYVNPKHEMMVKEYLKDYNGYIFTSFETNPEFREFERTSTTVVNAVLAPLISAYLQNLKNDLDKLKIKAPIYIMSSNGGLNPIDYTSKSPISIIESGPSAGVMASSYISNILGLERVITFDMGGTTAKAGTIIGGRPDISSEFEAAGKTHSGRSIKGSGYTVRFPFIDLAEVSAGGGTIAWVDEAGALRAGPKSAGADPGPAAYGLGGKEPTITDANIVLGKLNPEYLLGGKMKIYKHLSEEAIDNNIAKRMGIDIISAAEGIIKIINNSMAKAISIVSIERGRDPRDFMMISFGGAGPIHSCDLAEEIGISEILVPLNPGLFSAYGLLTVDIVRSFSRSGIGLSMDEIKKQIADMEQEAKSNLSKEGYENLEIEKSLDMHYVGQSYDLSIPLSEETDPFAAFKDEHKKMYGYYSNDPIEIVNTRVTAKVKVPKIELKESTKNDSKIKNKERMVYFNGKQLKTPVYTRKDLNTKSKGVGPSIIEGYDSTIVVNPGWSWSVDKYLNIILRRD
ncbi:MAG: hydantoinase/oxoprolinase family protein [Thermoplasmata archaeon]